MLCLWTNWNEVQSIAVAYALLADVELSAKLAWYTFRKFQGQDAFEGLALVTIIVSSMKAGAT